MRACPDSEATGDPARLSNATRGGLVGESEELRPEETLRDEDICWVEGDRRTDLERLGVRKRGERGERGREAMGGRMTPEKV